MALKADPECVLPVVVMVGLGVARFNDVIIIVVIGEDIDVGIDADVDDKG
jgi:hypothetical protein